LNSSTSKLRGPLPPGPGHEGPRAFSQGSPQVTRGRANKFLHLDARQTATSDRPAFARTRPVGDRGATLPPAAASSRRAMENRRRRVGRGPRSADEVHHVELHPGSRTWLRGHARRARDRPFPSTSCGLIAARNVGGRASAPSSRSTCRGSGFAPSSSPSALGPPGSSGNGSRGRRGKRRAGAPRARGPDPAESASPAEGRRGKLARPGTSTCFAGTWGAYLMLVTARGVPALLGAFHVQRDLQDGDALPVSTAPASSPPKTPTDALPRGPGRPEGEPTRSSTIMDDLAARPRAWTPLEVARERKLDSRQRGIPRTPRSPGWTLRHGAN